MPGTRVTCTDIETGESSTKVIVDDWVVVCDGVYEVANIASYPTSGTVQLTLKRADR